MDLTPIPVSTTSLPAGSYTGYFGVDLVKDGVLQFDSLFVAGVPFTR